MYVCMYVCMYVYMYVCNICYVFIYVMRSQVIANHTVCMCNACMFISTQTK